MLGRFTRGGKWRSERREFIYLDEVSVTSLIAARDGAIPETVTDKLSRTSESESRFSAEVPMKRANLGAQYGQRITDSSSHEVVRRAVIQSTFGSLRTGGPRDSAPLLRDNPEISAKFAGKFATASELTHRKQRKLAKAGLLTRLDTLSRGDVIEVAVRLRPHKLFTLVSAIESLADLMEGRDALFGAVAERLGEVTSIAEVIERLMVGLVPVHGIAANFAIVDLAGAAHLIDIRVIDPGSPLSGDARPFEVVALTENGSYWKDLRRVLYTANEYTVYARLIAPRLQSAWNPVKLADLMREVNETLAESFAEITTFADGAFDNSGDEAAVEPTVDVRGMFHRFADALARDTGVAPDPTSIADAVTVASAAYIADSGDLAAERAAFDIVAEQVAKAGDGEPISRSLIHNARSTVQAEARGLAALAAMSEHRAPGSGMAIDQLEVEVVAIYW